MNIGTATRWCIYGVNRGQRGPVSRMSHLHAQLHRFSLLSTQSHSAHWGLQLAQRDARLIHLAEVLGLHANSQTSFFFPRFLLFDQSVPSVGALAQLWYIPFLWRCWAYFQWSLLFAADFQDETAWLWSSQEPGQENSNKLHRGLIFQSNI